MQDRHEAELAEVRRRCALEAEDARRRCGVEAEEARSRAEAEVEAVRRRCEAELEDMRRRLRSEKNLRRACEKWLRSELKSRVRAPGNKGLRGGVYNLQCVGRGLACGKSTFRSQRLLSMPVSDAGEHVKPT